MSAAEPKYLELSVTKLKGRGNIRCPGCGTSMSPGDFQEKNYKIADRGICGDEIKSATLQCNKCGGQVKINDLSANYLSVFSFILLGSR